MSIDKRYQCILLKVHLKQSYYLCLLIKICKPLTVKKKTKLRVFSLLCWRPHYINTVLSMEVTAGTTEESWKMIFPVNLMQSDSLGLFLTLVSWALIPNYEDYVTFWGYGGSTTSSRVLIWLSQSKSFLFPPELPMKLSCSRPNTTAAPGTDPSSLLNLLFLRKCTGKKQRMTENPPPGHLPQLLGT